MNSRLDAIQAAILRIKLAHLPEAIRRRREIAARYDAHFSKHATWMTRPALGKGDTFYAYVVKCINGSRDALRLHLADAGIEAPIHFPIPVHAQPAFVEMFGAAENLERFAVSTKLASSVLSLPCHPALHDDEIDFIGESVDAFARKHGPL